jgi:hypothetical protein
MEGRQDMPEETEFLKQVRQAMIAGSPVTASQFHEQFLAAGGMLSAGEHLIAAKAFASAGNATLAPRHLARIVDRHDRNYATWLAASRARQFTGKCVQLSAQTAPHGFAQHVEYPRILAIPAPCGRTLRHRRAGDGDSLRPVFQFSTGSEFEPL